MSFVIYLSLAAVITPAFTEVIGYDAYISDKETGRSEKIYTHYYADGVDTRKAEYEALGIQLRTAELRSVLTGVGSVLVFSAAQAICLALFVAVVPNRMYRLGAQDAEFCEKQSSWRWLLPSLFPASVNVISFLLLVMNKLQWIGNRGLSLYRYANYHLYGLQRLILGTATSCDQIHWGGIFLALLPAVLTIGSCGMLYEFGYRGIHPLMSLKNKIKYKGN